MNELMEQIKKKDARAFTHGGKFHADDVFSAALLFYINPEITIEISPVLRDLITVIFCY